MAVNYTALAATAERLIRENGREVTIVKRIETPPVAATPWEGDDSSAETTVTADAVFFDELVGSIAGEPSADRTWIGMILIAANDAGTEDLTTFDAIRDGGRHIELASISPLKPGSTLLIYVAKKEGG